MHTCSTLLINHSPKALLNTPLTVGIGISTLSGFLGGWVGIAAQFTEAQYGALTSPSEEEDGVQSIPAQGLMWVRGGTCII